MGILVEAKSITLFEDERVAKTKPNHTKYSNILTHSTNKRLIEAKFSHSQLFICV